MIFFYPNKLIAIIYIFYNFVSLSLFLSSTLSLFPMCMCGWRTFVCLYFISKLSHRKCIRPSEWQSTYDSKIIMTQLYTAYITITSKAVQNPFATKYTKYSVRLKSSYLEWNAWKDNYFGRSERKNHQIISSFHSLGRFDDVLLILESGFSLALIVTVHEPAAGGVNHVLELNKKHWLYHFRCFSTLQRIQLINMSMSMTMQVLNILDTDLLHRIYSLLFSALLSFSPEPAHIHFKRIESSSKISSVCHEYHYER